MGPEWIIVGIIAVVVLFGAKKLPEMARSVGRAQGEFKKGLKEGHVERDDRVHGAAEVRVLVRTCVRVPAPPTFRSLLGLGRPSSRAIRPRMPFT